MFKRVSFCLGVFLGAVSVFAVRHRRQAKFPAAEPDPLLSLVGDAVIACDSAGAVTYLNAAAQEQFGADGSAAFPLCYPSGQPVPPGQHPLLRTLRTGKISEGAGYLCTLPNGTTCTLEISAQPLKTGGAAAVFRDITQLQEIQNSKTEAERREEILRRLCCQLSAAVGPDDLARSIADNALALLPRLPGAQVRLYAYDSSRKHLTRLASAPEDRPKRPRSQKSAQPLTFAFDASRPLLWQVYVARETFSGEGTDILGEGLAVCQFALPLIAGGAAIGHLSVACASSEMFSAPALRDSLGLLASVAALALAGPSQAAQTAHMADQVLAIREMVGAVAKRLEEGARGDLAAGHARHVLDAEVCTLAVCEGEKLRLLGEDYKDALLYPERHAPEDTALTAGAPEKAARTGKMVRNIGNLNSDIADGLWRAFAGQAGRHSVLSVPLPGGQGAMTVYRAGEIRFSDEEVRFLETLAALTAVALPSATPSANHTDS